MNQRQEKSSSTSQPRPVMRGPRGMNYMAKPQDFKGTMKKLLKYLKPYAFQVIGAGLMAIVAALLSVLAPWFLGLITSEVARAYEAASGVFANIEFGLIHIVWGIRVSMGELALMIVAVIGLSAAFNYLQAFLLIGMTQQLTYGMRTELSAKINKLPLKYFDSQQFGDLLGRVTNDVETINITLTQSISEIFRSIAMVIGIFGMMIFLSLSLTAVALVTTILSFIAVRQFVRLSQGYFRKQAKSFGELTGHIEETYGGHTVIKVFNHEEKSRNNFDRINDDLYSSAVKSQFISGIMFPVQLFFGNLAYIAIAVVGALLVLSDNPIIAIEVGIIQSFIQYIRQINQPIQQIGSIANVLQSTAAASERIFNLLGESEEIPERDKLTKLDRIKGHVVFNNVHFGYQEDIPIIKGFSAEVKPGQKVAIVGPTGAGKTTMVNLLMRFYEIHEGSITIDGIDIRDMSRSDLRSLFGMVLQDTWLFEGSVRENMMYGSPDKTEEDMLRAAKLAQTHHFIESLSGGYEFLLNEGGYNISQGQRQLLTISRAMLADRPMLILDEATSSVDTRTEVLIQHAMEALMKNRTSFVIAHRLSTIRDADVIFVMNDGNIVEHGNHQQLLDQKGFYAKLYYSQFETN
ncbi:MAG: ABC transporter ATP-binding protein [Acholeplasmataceae bacterium]|jgi:ATP-binding cassette subfamily B protein|nr:ABC transporter ATP-binding protein [Acholeplasmataceae bacterium]